MASLTINCTCGLTLHTDDDAEINGIAHCDCGAIYAYALTELTNGT